MLVLGSDSDIKKGVFPVAVGLGKSVMRGVFWRVFLFDGGSLCPNFLLERKNIITVSCFRFSYDFWGLKCSIRSHQYLEMRQTFAKNHVEDLVSFCSIRIFWLMYIYMYIYIYMDPCVKTILASILPLYNWGSRKTSQIHLSTEKVDLLTGTYTAIARQFHSNLVSFWWASGGFVGATTRVEVEEICESWQRILYFFTYIHIFFWNNSIFMTIFQMHMYVTSCYFYARYEETTLQ